MTLRTLRTISLSTAAALAGFAPALNAQTAANVAIYDAPQEGMDCTELPANTPAVSKPVVKSAPRKSTPKKVAAVDVEKRYPSLKDIKSYYASLEPKKPVVASARKPVAKKPVAEAKAVTTPGVKYACSSPNAPQSLVRAALGGGAPAAPVVAQAPAPVEEIVVAGGGGTPINGPVSVPATPDCPTGSFCNASKWCPPYVIYRPVEPVFPQYPHHPLPPVVWVPPSPPVINPPISLPVTPAVPEPSSYLMFGAGLSVLAWAARRKSAAAAPK